MWTDVSILAQEPDDMMPSLCFLILSSTFPPRSSTGHDDRDKKDYIWSNGHSLSKYVFLILVENGISGAGKSYFAARVVSRRDFDKF